MEETKEIQVPIEQTKPADPNSDFEVKEISPIEEAKKINEENKKLLDDMKKERERIEKIFANNMLSGKGLVSMPPKIETPKEYAERVMRGQIK